MVSLVGYTSDAWLHSAMYKGSTANSRIALFAVTNQTSRHTILYWRGSVQVRTVAGWVEDDGTLVGTEEMTGPLRPKHGEIIKFPVPDGTGMWRCSVEILDITYSKGVQRKWQGAIVNLLRRVGIGRERSYIIWSPELTR